MAHDKNVILHDDVAPDHVAILEAVNRFEGPIFTISDDLIEFNNGEHARRQYMIHDDAVAVVALRNSPCGYEVLLIRQYRHAPRKIFWEIPAGLRDDPNESALEAAQRELAEETGMRADHWYSLVSFYSSPGVSNENLDVFLATDVSEIESGISFVREAEEHEIESEWMPLNDLCRAVLSGDLRSPTLVLGIMAAYIHSQHEFRNMTPLV